MNLVTGDWIIDDRLTIGQSMIEEYSL